MKSLLVFAAHPDDEILGCGGTLARLAQQGYSIHIIIMAEGVTSREPKRNREQNAETLSELNQAAQHAGKQVGATSIELLAFADNRMDSIDMLDVIKVVEDRIAAYKPEIIFTHFPNDLNIDHRITAEAVMTASRPLPGLSVREIFFFETPSSTEWQMPYSSSVFLPNVYVGLTEQDLAKKRAALKMYASEMRPYPHARSYESVDALARWRGANSGNHAAEAFMLARRLW